jgi:hypothetical protein
MLTRQLQILILVGFMRSVFVFETLGPFLSLNISTQKNLDLSPAYLLLLWREFGGIIPATLAAYGSDSSGGRQHGRLSAELRAAQIE